MAVFEDLNALNINGHTEKKSVSGKELTYLSWPWAWAEVKKRYPGAHYTIWKNEKGLPYTVDPEIGYMVYTSVTIDEITHEMWLPVMDGANRAMRPVEYDYKVKNQNFKWAKLDQRTGKYLDKYGNEQPEYVIKHCEAATMMDINKAIMRCLVKNLAMFGLGLYIYAGEDLPEAEAEMPQQQNAPANIVQDVPGRATVTMGTTVPTTTQNPPQTAPEAQKPAPTPAPQPAPETLAAYFKRMINQMSADFGPTFNFVLARKALIDDGKIPNKPSSEIKTMEEAEQMIKVFYDNFGNAGKKAG